MGSTNRSHRRILGGSESGINASVQNLYSNPQRLLNRKTAAANSPFVEELLSPTSRIKLPPPYYELVVKDDEDEVDSPRAVAKVKKPSIPLQAPKTDHDDPENFPKTFAPMVTRKPRQAPERRNFKVEPAEIYDCSWPDFLASPTTWFKNFFKKYNFKRIGFRAWNGAVRGGYLGVSVIGLLFSVLLMPLTGGISLWSLLIPGAIAATGYVIDYVLKETRGQDTEQVTTLKHLNAKQRLLAAIKFVEENNYPVDVQGYRTLLAPKKAEPSYKELWKSYTSEHGQFKGALYFAWKYTRKGLTRTVEFLRAWKDSTRLSVAITQCIAAVGLAGVAVTEAFIINSVFSITPVITLGWPMLVIFAIPVILFSIGAVADYQLRRNRELHIKSLNKELEEFGENSQELEDEIYKHDYSIAFEEDLSSINYELFEQQPTTASQERFLLQDTLARFNRQQYPTSSTVESSFTPGNTSLQYAR